MTPRFVAAILDWRGTWIVARLGLVSPYLVGAWTKATDWPGAIAEQAHLGLQPAALFAALTIFVEVVGPLLILANRLVWLGAGMLGVLTFVAAFAADAYWTMTGPARFMAMNSFWEHMALVAGFIFAALLSRREGRTAA